MKKPEFPLTRREFLGTAAAAAGALAVSGVARGGAKGKRKHPYLEYNPYAKVDWKKARRCLAQHHDHVYVVEKKYRAYDQAGYGAVTVLHYSGVKSKKYTWQKRHWPLSDYLEGFASDEAFLASCKNLKLLLPGAEEVGGHHMTSPFLKTYIAKWEPKEYDQREEWHYASTQECIDLIRKHGGLPLIAHPWNPINTYRKLRNYHAIEIYSTFAAYQPHRKEREDRQDWRDNDRNKIMLKLWDVLLDETSTRIWGIAVNDWYGPPNEKVMSEFPDIGDSGKIMALLEEYTLESYRKALEGGAFFAIRDNGVQKGKIPVIKKIELAKDSISVDTDGAVKWITNRGQPLGANRSLSLKALPAKSTYVRAEVTNENGTVYVQPFSLWRER